MISGASYLVNNIHSKSLFPQIQAKLKVGRILESQRTEPTWAVIGSILDKGVSSVIVYCTFGNIRPVAFDGSTAYATTGLNIYSFLKPYAEGSTMSITYMGLTRETFYRTYSTDGLNWGGTENILITGDTYIRDFAPLSNRIYYLSGTSYETAANYKMAELKCLVREGATWKSYRIDGSRYAAYVRYEDGTPSEYDINVFERENGLDEIFVRTNNQTDQTYLPNIVDSEIIRLVSNGKALFEKEIFLKSEQRTSSNDSIIVSMRPSVFGSSSSMKVLPIMLKYSSKIAGSAGSYRTQDLGMQVSYSKEFGNWSGFETLNGSSNSLFSGITEGIWHGIGFREGTTALFFNTYTETGSTQLDISNYITRYSNENNERISLELGNYA